MGDIVQESMRSTEDILEDQIWVLETIVADLENKVECYKQENKALRRMLSQTELEEALCQ